MKNNSSHISESGIFFGYASVFNYMDSQKDIVLPGAFTDSLNKKSIALLWQHNFREPVGKILHLKENSFGLLIKAQLNLELQKARDILSMVQKEIILSLSIGYRTVSSKRFKNSEARLISKIDLWEVSFVTFPANKLASILCMRAEYKT